MNKVSCQAEQLAAVCEDWLRAEVITSGEGNNRVLDVATDDDLELKRAQISHPYGDDRNLVYKKHSDHENRLWANYWPAFESAVVGEPDADLTSATVTFAAQMEQSGGYRRQCYLEAQSAQDYNARRLLGTGIDIEAVAYEQLARFTPDGRLNRAAISADDLRHSLEDAITADVTNIKNVVAHAMRDIKIMGVENSLPAQGTKKAQISWARAVTNSIILAAKMRKGELEAVPFREPVSITYQSGDVHYPLAAPIDWMKIVTEKGLWPNPSQA